MLKDKNKLAYFMFFLLAAIFVIIVSKGLTTPQPGDENVYYYMGKLISEGKVPYKDFFYAHPPLHIYLMALIYKIFGFNIAILKSIPFISTLASAFFVFKIAREKFGNYEAVASSLLFLFSYSIMFNSVFSFGINTAAMLVVIGFYLLWNKSNYILSGIFFGLAGITRLLSLIPVFVILAAVLLSSRKNFVKLASSFLTIFLLVNLVFAVFFGDSYLAPVYKFHLLKSFGARENLREYSDIINLNWILFLSAIMFIFAKDKKKINIFAAVSAAYLIFLITLKKIFGFYFIIVFPFLAIIGGYSIARIFNSLNLTKKQAIIVLIALSSIFAWNLASDAMFLEKIGFRGFERGKDLAGFVNSVSDKGTMLFGDDSVVPLLALLTKKNIAFDLVDTNNEVFLSGLVDLNSILAKLKGNSILFIIRDKQGISSFSGVREFLNENCGLLSSFHDKIEGRYLVYRCN